MNADKSADKGGKEKMENKICFVDMICKINLGLQIKKLAKAR